MPEERLQLTDPWASFNDPPADPQQSSAPQTDTQATVAEAAPDTGIIGTVADVVKQIAGGAFKEAENVVQSGHDIADFVDNALGSGEAIEDEKDYDFVPDVLKPKTAAGKTAQALSAFAWGWFGGGKLASLAMRGISKALPAAAKLAKAAPNSEWVRRTLKGGAVDFVTGDGTDERFADVLMDNDILADTWLRYLASEEDDSFAEARLKNAVEGFGLGIASDALGAVFRGMKKVYKAGQKGGPEAALKARAEAAEEIQKAVETAQPQTAALTGTADERIAAVGGVKSSMTLTDAAAAQQGRQEILAAPKAVSAKLKADTQKALNTRRYTQAAQALLDAYQEPLGEAAAPLRMNMAEKAAEAIDYIVDSGLDKALDKDKLISLRSTGSREDMLKATASEVMYLNTFAPQHVRIQLERVAEGIEGAQADLRKTAEDLFDVVYDLKSANMFGGQLGKINDIVRSAGRAVTGEAAQTAAETAAPRTGKELFANMTDEQVAETLTTFNRMVENGDAKTAKEFLDIVTDGKAEEDFLDKVLKYRYIAMLSSIKTQERNLLGNTLKIPLMAFEESVKGAVRGWHAADGSLLGAFSSAKNGAKNGLYFLQGIAYAQRQAGETFLNALKYNVPITRAGEMQELSKKQSDWGVFALPTRLLRASDEYFSTLGGAAAAYERAMLDLKASGVLKGASPELAAEIREKWLRDYLPQAFGTVTTQDGKTIRGSLRFKESIEAANELTFQQDLGDFAQSLYNIVNKYRPLKFLFPFVKTPTNIFKDALWTRGINAPREFLNAFRKGAAPEQQATAAAHMASAALLWGSAWTLYHSGRLTGAGPDGDLAKAAKQETGWRANSLKVGDSYVTLDAFEPFGTVAGVIASFMERLEAREADGDGAGLEEIGMDAFGTMLHIVQNKTYLKGLASFFNSVTNDATFESYGMAGQFAASFAPSILRDFGYAIDPVRRETPDVFSKFSERMPFVRESLPPRVNWLTGRDMETGNGFLGAFLDGLNISKEQDDAVMYELSRLSGVSDPDKKIQGVELTPEEYAEYRRTIGTVRIGGRTLYKALADLINSDLYQRNAELRPDPSPYEIEAGRAEQLRKLIQTYKETGRQQFLRNNPAVMQKIRGTKTFAGITNF